MSWQVSSNIRGNAKDIVKSITLSPCGTKIECENVLGGKKTYSIKHLRRLNDRELQVVQKNGGAAGA